jgi:cleavage and polyadenylation specificity factor subunit 1
MATEQNHCAEMQHLLCSSSLILAFQQAGVLRLVGDVSTGVFCPIIPAKLLKDIFLHLHSISYPAGRLASRCLVSSWFVWRGLTNDITSWAKSCLHCQRSKIHRHTRLLPQPIPINQQGFAHFHIDLVGPLQYSSGCNHIFTIIDRTSKWMEALPLSETSAEACAHALVFSWITHFGVP